MEGRDHLNLCEGRGMEAQVERHRASIGSQPRTAWTQQEASSPVTLVHSLLGTVGGQMVQEHTHVWSWVPVLVT